MSSKSSIDEYKKRKNFTQTLYLPKSQKTSEAKSNYQYFEKTFKLNKMSYLDVKNRKFIFFGFGKITLSPNIDNNYININFHDSSLQLRFQGFISIKLSSINLDINKNYCIIINKIIGIIYDKNNSNETITEKILTNIYLYFKSEDELNQFLDSLIHI